MKRTKKINEFISNLETMISEMSETKMNLQDTYDNKSEKAQESDKGQEMYDNLSNLEDVCNALESALGSMEDLFESD